MIAQPIPLCDENDYSVLYHLTSLNGARDILTSGIFLSFDPDRQASFSAIIKRPSLARSSEICLRFRWKGSQAMYFGDPFGHGEPQSNGLKKPILYHIFHNPPLMPGEKLRSKNYWQSNLYPGSNGLVFEGIEEIHIRPPKIPSKPSRFFFWGYAKKLKAREEICDSHKQILEIKKLALTKQNSVFSVP